MSNRIKMTALAVLLSAAACGTVTETAPEGATRAALVEPIGPPAGVTSEDNCEQVARWIDQNRDKLPSAYDQIIRFPDQYRSAIFAALTPEIQSALFKTQIARFRQRPSLTEEQRAVLDRADALMSPALYATHDSPEYLATVEMQQDLKGRSMVAFGFEGTRALMANLGPPDDTNADPPIHTLALPTCACSTVSDYCIWGLHCHAIPCEGIHQCGDWFAYRCNGVCGQGL